MSIKDSVQQQIQFNGNVFGNKCYRCNEVSLYHVALTTFYLSQGLKSSENPTEQGSNNNNNNNSMWKIKLTRHPMYRK